MLEEILKNINLNLERIANSLEMNSKYSVGIDLANGKDENVSATVTAPQIEASKVELAQPSAITISTMPIQQSQPVISQPIPTTQNQESFTQEQLAVAMSNAVSAGKMQVIQGILQQMGVQALTQINPNDYNKVATLLKESGVEV